MAFDRVKTVVGYMASGVMSRLAPASPSETTASVSTEASLTTPFIVAPPVVIHESKAILDVEKKLDIDIRKIVNTPHFYQLINSAVRAVEDKKEEKQDRKLKFFVFGCAGDGTIAQKKVAEIMAAAKEKPDFIIVLGDNFYDHGVDNEADPVFKTLFEDIYKICGVPCFVILGNHDYNICRTGNVNGVIDEKKINAQVMHTFLGENKEIDPEKIKKYQTDTLDLATLPIWNMPSRVNVLRPHENVNIFLTDTNAYLTEYAYLLLMREDEDDKKVGKVKEKKESIFDHPEYLEKVYRENNQAEYLEKIYRERPAPINLICKHHPSHTIGKRSEPELDDAWQYLNPKVIEYLRAKGFTGTFYDMIQKVFKDQNMLFDMEFDAHDHMNYVYMDGPLTEVVVGGGGGEPQDRVEYKTAENVPFCESGVSHGTDGYGYAEVTIDPNNTDPKKRIVFAINNTQDSRYEFSPGNKIAHREAKDETFDVLSFRELMLRACDDYLKVGEVGWGSLDRFKSYKKIAWFITPKPDLLAVGKIKNYLNEYKAKTLLDYIKFVKDFSPVPFLALLNEKFFKDTKYVTFEKFSDMFFPKATATPVVVEESKKGAVELADATSISRNAAVVMPAVTTESKEEIKSTHENEGINIPRSLPTTIPVKAPAKMEQPTIRFSPFGSPTIFSKCVQRSLQEMDASASSSAALQR